MQFKSAFASKTVWAGIVTAVASFLKLCFNVDVTDLVPGLVDNVGAVITLIAGIVTIYGRIRATKLIAPKPTTGVLPAIAACLSPIFGLGCFIAIGMNLSSCSTVGPVTPDETRALTSVAVSNGLQFGIKDSAQRVAVAQQMVNAIGYYTTYSNGGVPTPEQFQAVLNQYLPAGETKALTVSNLTALYTLRYASFKDLKIPDQAGYLNSFLSGVKDGAAPFAGPRA